MMVLWRIFAGSLPLQLVSLAVVGWLALKANNFVQRSRGASELAAKIEAKSDATAKTADEVRQEAATSKRGRPDPHRADRVRN